MTPQRPPDVVGCAIGFAAAGSGAGSLVGTAVGRWFFPPLPPGVGTPHDQLMAMYGGTLWGIGLGVAVGFAAGVWYAVSARRRRTRAAG